MASIEKRGNSYRVIVCTGRDIYGKQLKQTATFTPDSKLTERKKQKAVQDFAYEFEHKVLNGLIFEGRKTSLKEFVDRWLEEYAVIHLEPGTVEKYTAELNKVLPALGHIKLTELRPHLLNSFFVSLTKDGARKDGKPGGYSKNSIAKTKNVLSSVLRTAADWELIEKNPLERVRYQAEASADKIKYFTPEQAFLFLQYIDAPYTVVTKGHKRIDDTGMEYMVEDYESTRELPAQMKVLFYLALYGGLRKGELLALEWSDIDFEKDTVSVSKSVAIVNHQQIVKSPKTKNSHRKVTIPHFLTLRIKQLKNERTRYRLLLGDYWQGAEWLFIQENGKQMNYSTPYSTFHDALIRYNRTHETPLPVIPFHGLRHTSATLLIASKQDVRSVSSRLGHAQASTTMNIYAHALETADKHAADALETILTKEA